MRAVRLQVEVLSDDDDDESAVLAVSDDKYWPGSLEKMIHLVAHLVEKSRLPDNSLGLSEKDKSALVGGKVCTQSLVGQLHVTIVL